MCYSLIALIDNVQGEKQIETKFITPKNIGKLKRAAHLIGVY